MTVRASVRGSALQHSFLVALLGFIPGCGDDGEVELCLPCVSGVIVEVTPVPLEDGESTVTVMAGDGTIGSCTMTKDTQNSVSVVCDGAELVATIEDDIFTPGDGTFLGVNILGEFSGSVQVHIQLETPTQILAGTTNVSIEQSGGADCGPMCTGGRSDLELEISAP